MKKIFEKSFIYCPYKTENKASYITNVTFYRRKIFIFRNRNVSMINKKELKGKFITFIDKDGKFRTQKVIKIYGNYLTVRTTIKIKNKLYKSPRRRIYKNNVIGRQFEKKGLEEIKWKK